MRGAAYKPLNVRAAVAVAVVFFVVGAGWRRSHARVASQPPSLAATRKPRAGERILIVAPHPDDETLGLGGFLHDARRRGADVRVAFLTSGDGFPLCAAAKYHRWPGSSRMRQLAADRENEACTALSKLGVSRAGITFFGYPDRGLATLWQSNWTTETPYQSPYTGESKVPESRALQRSPRPYCGEAVLRDIEALLRSYRPDRVLYPDPADDHPDHWASHCFVQLALERLRGEPWADRVERRTYLIHRGEWPEPMRTDRSLYLAPPSALTRLDSEWENVPLRREDLNAKSAALQAYHSQQALAGNFLNAFLRRNELLVRWPEIGAQPTKHHPDSAADPPAGRALLLSAAPFGEGFPDSTGDRFARSRWGAVDFTGLQVENEPAAVKLSVLLRKPAAGWPTYYLYWKPVSGAPGGIRTRRFRISGYRCDPPTARFTIDGQCIQVTLPRSELGGSERIMLAASAWSGPILLDRTPWRVVSVAGKKG